MDRQAFLRQLQLFTLTGAAATFPLVVNAQQPTQRSPSQIEVQGSEPISNPVPQGYGRVNPRDLSVGQGGGQYGDPRVRTGGRVDQHNGIDLPAPVGSPVLAPVSGLVVRPTNPGRDGYGDQVRIVDADGRLYILGHLSSTNVQPGAYVNAGQQVGEIGRSGNSPQNGASHLHLEVRDQNNQSIRLNSTPATDPTGAAAGLENYLDSLPTRPSSRPSQAPQMRTPTQPQPRQAQPLSMLDRLLDFIIPSAAASTLSDPLNAGTVSNNPTQPLRTTTNEYAPRNGYDENGNRADSTRRQYDAQGYYANPSTGASQTSQDNFYENDRSQPTEWKQPLYPDDNFRRQRPSG